MRDTGSLGAIGDGEGNDRTRNEWRQFAAYFFPLNDDLLETGGERVSAEMPFGTAVCRRSWISFFTLRWYLWIGRAGGLA